MKHKEVKHVHTCDICEDEYIGDAEFDRHNNIVHHSAEVILTKKEFEELTDCEKEDIIFGPDTPRKEDFFEKVPVEEEIKCLISIIVKHLIYIQYNCKILWICPS